MLKIWSGVLYVIYNNLPKREIRRNFLHFISTTLYNASFGNRDVELDFGKMDAGVVLVMQNGGFW